MSWAELGGERIQSGSITIPWFRAWAADVLLAESAEVPAQTTLTIGDLSMVCHVVRQASFAGSRGYRLVGGYGCWRNIIAPRYYQSGGALPLSMILGDAATEAGERVSVPSDRMIGPQYVRSEGPASRVLEQLAPDWWIAPDGVTHIGPRDTSPITTPLTVINYSGGKGKFEIGTEAMADWMPGRTFTSQTISDPVTIGAVTITMTNEGHVSLDVLRADSPDVDRLSSPLDAIIAARFPDLAYMIPWEFTVVDTHQDIPIVGAWTLDVLPTSPQCPMPGMTKIEYLPPLPGLHVKPANGTSCAVIFLNGDPQRPRVIGFDATAPDEVDLIGLSPLPAQPIARHLDMAGPFPITATNTLWKVGL